MKPLHEIGVAVVGTGFMCAVHVEALRRVPVRVVGVLGSSPGKSRAAAASLGLPRGYASLDELLADPAVDAVHVNTPNRFHLEQASAALRAGKHVMCEKPLAMDRAEAAELVKVAREHPRQVAAVNYNNRFYPLCHDARDLIRRGEAGRLFHVTGSVAQDWLARDTDYNWRVLASEGGALRALSDTGSHWLDLVHFVTGLEAEAVFADYATVHPVRRRPRGEVETFSRAAAAETEPVDVTTDDYGCVMIRFVGGARGCLWVSQVSPGRKYSVRFEVAGQERTVAWDSEEPERMWVGRRDGPSLAVHRNPAELSPAARGVTDYPAGHAEGYPDSFKQCFRAFYRYVAAGDHAAPRPFATFEDGQRDIVLCDAFVESHRRGGWVRLDEFGAIG